MCVDISHPFFLTTVFSILFLTDYRKSRIFGIETPGKGDLSTCRGEPMMSLLWGHRAFSPTKDFLTLSW